MSKLDRMKAQISVHEKLFFAALAVVLALLGWGVNQTMGTVNTILVLGAIALLAAIVFAIWHYKKMKRLIMELEDV